MIAMGETQSTDFDWRIYADATAAGLTALIPIPLVDLAFESTFRRRIPGAVARARNRVVTTSDRIRLSQGEKKGLSLAGCLILPVSMGRYILKKIWRKVVYVFAVTDATKQVSEYWHRAYLTDHMVRSGHLEDGADTDWAILVYGQVLREIDPSPLMDLAREVVTASHRVFRTLIRARKSGAAATTAAFGEILKEHWEAADQSLQEAALRYNELYSAGPPTSGQRTA